MRTRSALRVRMRSGSASSTGAPGGSRSVSRSSSASADQRRDQRLHALGRDALGEALQQLAQGRVVLVGPGERRGPVAHLDGEQQLPAPGRVQHLDGGDRALIGDGEAAQLADLVSPELDAHGVLGRGREDVDDPAADGELAARRDHLDPRVRQLDEPDQQAVEVVGVTDAQRHRLQPAQAGRDRLDQAACGGDDQPRRGGRVGEAPEDRQPAADGVRARREALVRQRLPAGQHGDGVATEQVPRGGGQILGLPVGGGDGEHGATAVGECGAGCALASARAAARNGRSAAGPSTASAGTPVVRRLRDAAVRAPSSGSEVASRPESLATVPLAVISAQQSGPLPGTDGGHVQATRADSPASRHLRRRESARSPVASRGGCHRTETRGAGGGNTGGLHCPRLTNR